MRPPIAIMAAAALLAAAQAAGAQSASPPPGAAPSAQRPPNWKKLLSDNQYAVYIDQDSQKAVAPAPGHPVVMEMTAVVQYNVPEVVNNFQVSSTVYRIDFDCGHPALFGVELSDHSSDMGAGPAVLVSPADSAWHTPQAGTLDQTLWDAACGAKPSKAP